MRGRSSRRVRELTSSPEFVDAFVESALPLSTRRALRQTCRMWRHKMEEFLTKRQTLVLREQDCTDADAAFVLGPLNRRHGRELNLQLEGGGHVELFRLVHWLEKYECRPRGVTKYNEALVPSITRPPEPNPTAAFYMGRAVATLTKARIHIEFDEPASGWGVDGLGATTVASTMYKTGTYKIPAGIAELLRPDDWRLLAGCYRVLAEDMVGHLMNNSSLCLRGARLDDAGARWLCDHANALVARPGCVQYHWPDSLDLSNTVTPISLGILPLLGSPYQFTTRLNVLILRNNPFPEHEGMMAALVGACRRGAFPALKVLRLDSTRLRDREMQELAPCFRPGGGLERLQVLDLEDNELTGDGLQHFMQCAKKMHALERLELEMNRFWFVDLRALASWIAEQSEWFNAYEVSCAACVGDSQRQHERAEKLLRNACRYRRQRWRWETLVADAYAERREGEERPPSPDVGNSGASSPGSNCHYYD